MKIKIPKDNSDSTRTQKEDSQKTTTSSPKIGKRGNKLEKNRPSEIILTLPSGSADFGIGSGSGDGYNIANSTDENGLPLVTPKTLEFLSQLTYDDANDV